MSDRHNRTFELYPFKRVENKTYGLNQWNDPYRQRFEFFLKETQKRDVIAQIQVWDRFDYSRDNWPPHPSNPDNNINYAETESGLAPACSDPPGRNKHPIFFTTPKQQNNKIVFRYQKKNSSNTCLPAH